MTLTAVALLVATSTGPVAKAGGRPIGQTNVVPRVPDIERWGQSSLLVTKATIADLQRVAEDRKADFDTRARAICSLFATYLKPPKSSKAAGAVFGKAGWFAGARTVPVDGTSGIWPIDLNGEVFVLYLFPTESDPVKWVIYLRFDGENLFTADDLRAFFTGRKRAETLMEFAIVFPSGKAQMGRVERFGVKGIAVVPPL